MNQLLIFKQPRLTLSSPVVQILVYPTGFIFAQIVPTREIGFLGYKFALNPGPWSYRVNDYNCHC